jgi:hypothetical protein
MNPDKKPIGKSLERTPEELDRLSEITPADIEASKAAVSGTIIGKILDSELTEDTQQDL